jgi:hypothetical protein
VKIEVGGGGKDVPEKRTNLKISYVIVIDTVCCDLEKEGILWSKIGRDSLRKLATSSLGNC